MLIVSNWFEHNKSLVMDNARMHMANEAECVEYYLWNMIIDGRPLHAKSVYLPTGCPELNPIEFMFHLLSNQVQSFWYQIMGAIDCEWPSI
jgi:transposase